MIFEFMYWFVLAHIDIYMYYYVIDANTYYMNSRFFEGIYVVMTIHTNSHCYMAGHVNMWSTIVCRII
jgi:hypothetical protein